VVAGVRMGAEAVKLAIAAAAITVTVACATVLPVPLVAVSVYIVVFAGFTVTDVPLTGPTPLSIVTVVAPTTVHASVTPSPAVMLAAEAAKRVMAGAGALLWLQPSNAKMAMATKRRLITRKR